MKVEKPAIFFDRDGVLNEDLGYVFEPKNFKWVIGAKEAIKFVNDLNFFVIVVTNQSGIARGYFSLADLDNLHQWMNIELQANNAKIDKFYFCPHYPDGVVEKYSFKCSCRKPKPGMILKAFEDWPIITSKSILIGDKKTDLDAAEAAGIQGHLYKEGNLLNFLKKILI
ncbi:MAG: D,D-heptose 1,7-bisphosphate phosphatase [Rhodospirillaceae bacterium]|nr:D,D-heptose 1,7-bisphosphate phosphatase [Rhodospirillaceae bacterium]|tara:strand:+ start:101 stop:607 length:507 start_codon:yes stop_codon:yes gene_type:complete